MERPGRGTPLAAARLTGSGVGVGIGAGVRVGLGAGFGRRLGGGLGRGLSAAVLTVVSSAVAAASQVAYGGTTDGKTIYENLCTGCHTSGAGGAPKLDGAGIGARAAQGLELLVKHAIEGYTGTAGVMPAKGGNPALTDEQVKATVEWMVAQSQ